MPAGNRTDPDEDAPEVVPVVLKPAKPANQTAPKQPEPSGKEAPPVPALSNVTPPLPPDFREALTANLFRMLVQGVRTSVASALQEAAPVTRAPVQPVPEMAPSATPPPPTPGMDEETVPPAPAVEADAQ